MNLQIKRFSQLSLEELYEILRVRCAVFIVEQHCPYQDIDSDDQQALHLFYEEDGKIAAYLRILPYKAEPNQVKIGRVLTMNRGCGLGGKLLSEGIRAAKEQMQADSIFIEAQSYATGFYEKYGFRVCGEEFLEDDIPHKPMVLEF